MAESVNRIWRPEIGRLYTKYRVFFPQHALEDFIKLLDDANEAINSRSGMVCESELAKFLKAYRGWIGGVEGLANELRELISRVLEEVE